MRSKGFTLLELLVSIGIIIVLLGISLHFYKLYHAPLACQGATQILAQDLVLAGNQAASYEMTFGITVDNNTSYHVWETNLQQAEAPGGCSKPNYVCDPSQTCFPSCASTVKTVNLANLYPIPVKVISAPGSCASFPCTVTFYPQSAIPGSQTWSVVKTSPTGSFVLQSNNATHQVIVNANGTISIQ